MGFYLSKSIKVGPFRFNLSKSGVGVSAGIRGLRVGTGPRGNYVHMGRHGLYYRATLPSGEPSPRPGGSTELPTAEAPVPTTHEPLQEIESADVSQIVDSSSRDLLEELSRKSTRMVFWPFVLGLSVFFLLLSWVLAWPLWSSFAILVAGGAATAFVYQKDLLAKTVVLFYDFDPTMEKAYGLLHRWAEQLAACSKVWHIEAQGRVRDRKYHAGAGSLVQRNSTFIEKREPPYVKTNVETVAIGVGRQTLHFFPDRVLVYDAAGVGAVGYGALELDVVQRQFIEDGGVARDAKVVDRTWRYVNKKGGPDRRFKDNPELPVCLYDEMRMTSASGLNEVIQLSRCEVAEGFAKAVEHLAASMPPERGEAESGA